MPSVLARILKILEDDFDQVFEEEKAPFEDFNLIDDVGLDSLDRLEFAYVVELEFGIGFKDEETERCLTIGDVVELVESKLNG